MSRPLLPILALAAVFLAIVPALDAGFLADDFYMIERIHARASGHGGLLAALADAFAYRWTPDFDVFRPLTILTLQADFVLHGTEAGRHHLTNVALWIVLSALFASTVASLNRGKDRARLALDILLFGLCPAAVECVGWVVAREDLLCALFGLLSLRLLLAHPDRPVLWTAALAPAFLAKESAVVLPPLLLWTDRILGRLRGGAFEDTRPFQVRRHAGTFTLLAAYFGLRYALFDRLGGVYNGRPYSEWLSRPGIVEHIAVSVSECFWRLVAPVNAAAWLRLTGLPVALAQAVPTLAATILVILGIRRTGTKRLRPFAAAIAWIVLPLALLVVPLHGVGSDMRLSRFLLLPLIGWGLALSITIRHALRESPHVASAAVALLLASGFAFWRIDLDAYRTATERAQAIAADVTSKVPRAGRGILLRAQPPGSDGGLDDTLIWHEGVHLLSAGLFSAVHPPFVAEPGITLEALPLSREDELAAHSTPSPDGQQPWLFALRHGPDRPHLVVLAPGTLGADAENDWEVTPAHGTQVSRQWDPVFSLADRSPGRRLPYRVRITVAEPGGGLALAAIQANPPVPPAASVEIPGSAFRLKAPSGEMLAHPLDRSVIAGLPSPWFVWWAEFDDAAGPTGRLPFCVIGLRP